MQKRQRQIKPWSRCYATAELSKAAHEEIPQCESGLWKQSWVGFAKHPTVCHSDTFIGFHHIPGVSNSQRGIRDNSPLKGFNSTQVKAAEVCAWHILQ